MKQAVRPLVIAALSLGFVQSMHPVKQKVFASKTDDPGREVEVKIFGADRNKPISSSKFKKNTIGLGTKSLYFDFAKGYEDKGKKWNKIEAKYVDGPQQELQPLEVHLAPKGSKIELINSEIKLVDKNGKAVSQELSKPETLSAKAAQSQTQLLNNTLTLTTIPAHIDLKARLVSKLDANYTAQKKRLVKGDLAAQQTAVNALMVEKLPDYLLHTPYVQRALELAKPQPEAVTNIIKEKVKELEKDYEALKPVLMGQQQIDSALEDRIKTMRRDIDEALTKL